MQDTITRAGKRMIYLDNNATTPLDPEVLDAMMPYLTDEYGNPGSLYGIGRHARNAIAKAREQVADFINAREDQIIFTSSGTEANAMAILSNTTHLALSDKKRILTSAVEHDSILKASDVAKTYMGFDVSQIPVDQSGVVQLESAKAMIDINTGLVSVMYVNNETGSVNPVMEIAEICRNNGTLFHTDCVQAASSFALDINDIGCDFMSISSHKIHGPKGCGALFCANPMTLRPIIPGGAVQEYGLRGGTENVAAIVGFGKACEITKRNLRDISIHTSALKQVFYTQLKLELSEYSLDGILKINGESIVKPGKTLNIRFDGVDGETLLLLLDRKGVCVSAGSACRSLESTPSHVLIAMGVDPEDAHNSIRVSFSKTNGVEEVVEAAKIIAACVKAIKVMG